MLRLLAAAIAAAALFAASAAPASANGGVTREEIVCVVLWEGVVVYGDGFSITTRSGRTVSRCEGLVAPGTQPRRTVVTRRGDCTLIVRPSRRFTLFCAS